MRRKRKQEREASWQGMSDEMMILMGLTDWRQHHAKASLREIEEAIDEGLSKLRAQMIEDAVSMSEQAEWSQEPTEQRPRCEHCGTPLLARGKQTRLPADQWRARSEVGADLWDLSTVWTRCFSRLYEELELDGRDLTPRAQEGLAHLSAWMPFARAAQLLETLVGVQVSRATARRVTQHLLCRSGGLDRRSRAD